MLSRSKRLRANPWKSDTAGLYFLRDRSNIAPKTEIANRALPKQPKMGLLCDLYKRNKLVSLGLSQSLRSSS
jgi:hypothetical protein